MIELIALFAGVLVLSGFFSGAEAVLISLSHAEVEEFMHRKTWGAFALKKIFDNLNRTIIAIVVMNNGVNIIGSVLVGNTTLRVYGDAKLAIVTAALTFGVIIFSEILPKSLGMHYNQKLAIPVAIPMRTLTLLLLPAIILLEKFTNAFKRGDGRKVGTEQQIRALANLGRRAGHIKSDEGQLVHRAFLLNDKAAKDIMTPLKDIVGVGFEQTIQEAADHVFRENFSRFPVFGTSINVVEGMVMSHDILQALSQGNNNDHISTILEPTLVIPGTMKCDALLVLFRDKKKHLAIVQEDDKTIGLVTLEDVLEELVGNIEDELDARD